MFYEQAMATMGGQYTRRISWVLHAEGAVTFAFEVSIDYNMAGRVHKRFCLRFSVIVKFAVFLSVIEGMYELR